MREMGDIKSSSVIPTPSFSNQQQRMNMTASCQNNPHKNSKGKQIARFALFQTHSRKEN